MSTSLNEYQEQIEWCIQRAEICVDRGDYDGAIISFLCDVDKHNATQHLAKSYVIVRIILNAHRGNKELFLKAMRGFY